MQKFSIPDMLASSRRRGILVGVGVPVPLGVEQQYLRELRRLLRAVHNATRDTVMPLVTRELALDRVRRQLGDAVELSWFERLEQLSASLLRSVFGNSGRIRNVVWHQIEKHTGNFIGSVRRAFGLDVSAMVRANDVADYFENAIRRQVVEVKGMMDDVITRVRRVVTAGVIAGAPVDEIRRNLREQFEKVDARARFIARDQVANTNTELAEIRHSQAGITEYKWRTRRDESVRALHMTLDGRIYRHGEPTGAENGLPPGRPPNCRCFEIPIVRLPYSPRR